MSSAIDSQNVHSATFSPATDLDSSLIPQSSDTFSATQPLSTAQASSTAVASNIITDVPTSSASALDEAVKTARKLSRCLVLPCTLTPIFFNSSL